MTARDEDHLTLDRLVARFFALFDNRGGRAVRLQELYELFVAEAVIVKAAGEVPEILDLPRFIEPRQRLLEGSSLAEFSESELESRTEVFGNIAQRFSTYRKSGVLDGERFETRGMKTFQFIRTADGWRMSALAWDDEREGLHVGHHPAPQG